MSDAELLAPVAPQEQAPPPEPEPVAATPETEDADLDKIIEEQGIDLPDGIDKMVPLAAVTNAREKLKTARQQLKAAEEGTAKATALEAKVASLEQQLSQVTPYAQAYQAALQAQPAEAAPKGPTPEEAAELEEIARDNDYYRTDGALDLDRAKRQQARIYKAAEKIAQQTVAPYQQQTLTDRSTQMLHNAKLTTLPDGSKPDPAVVDWIWSRIDPNLTSTKEGAQQAWIAAIGHAMAIGKMVKGTTAQAREPLPPPILTEKSGGRDHVATTLTEADKRSARDLNMTDKEYAEELGKMPQGWGRTR
jgi:hypothetical protein